MSVQGPVKQFFSGRADLPVILYPYLLWSDGSQLTVCGTKFHVVNIAPANWPLQRLRSKKGHRRLALLPVVNPDLGCAA